MKRMSSRCRIATRALARGFTLIELMIVVAIVGMLAAIAMPQYQIYTGKAQLTEALHLTESRKSVIAERIQFGHPMASIDGGTDGIPSDIATAAGRYVESLVIASGTIVATMKTTGVSSCAGGETISLAPLPPSGIERPISWVCTTSATCKPQTCG